MVSLSMRCTSGGELKEANRISLVGPRILYETCPLGSGSEEMVQKTTPPSRGGQLCGHKAVRSRGGTWAADLAAARSCSAVLGDVQGRNALGGGFRPWLADGA